MHNHNTTFSLTYNIKPNQNETGEPIASLTILVDKMAVSAGFVFNTLFVAQMHNSHVS
jgi:hypothetical protein